VKSVQEAEGLSPSPHPRGAITWRSVSLGMLATIFICSIAYYNDFAVNNTFFIGNNLPLGLVLMTFLLWSVSMGRCRDGRLALHFRPVN